MKALINSGYLSLRMTDDAAKVLIAQLQAVVDARAAMAAVVPEMKDWDDVVQSRPGLLGKDGVQISISVCGL